MRRRARVSSTSQRLVPAKVAAGSVRVVCEHTFVFDARKLTPSEKGGVAEMAIAWHATRLGIGVLRPTVEGLRYDLAFDFAGPIQRVQCKWGTLRDGAIVVRVSGSRLTPGRGYVRSTYSAEEIDAIAVYCADNDTTYYIPIEEVAWMSYLHLRVSGARNNQRSLVRWAAQYELGAIAQLEERRYGIPEAEGSSPSSSTPPKAASTGGLRLFRT